MKYFIISIITKCYNVFNTSSESPGKSGPLNLQKFHATTFQQTAINQISHSFQKATLITQ